MGGAVAQGLATRRPDRVTALVLLCTSSRVGGKAKQAYEQMAADLVKSCEPSVAEVALAMSSYNFDKSLAKLNLPVYIAGRQGDPKTPMKALEILRDCISGAELHTFSGASHDILNTEPSASTSISSWLKDTCLMKRRSNL